MSRAGWDNRPISGERGNRSPRMTIALTDDDRDDLAHIAGTRHVSRAEAIRLLIREEINRRTT